MKTNLIINVEYSDNQSKLGRNAVLWRSKLVCCEGRSKCCRTKKEEEMRNWQLDGTSCWCTIWHSFRSASYTFECQHEQFKPVKGVLINHLTLRSRWWAKGKETCSCKVWFCWTQNLVCIIQLLTNRELNKWWSSLYLKELYLEIPVFLQESRLVVKQLPSYSRGTS